MTMQHKFTNGMPIAAGRDSFDDRMRRIAALNLAAASSRIVQQYPEGARWFCLQVRIGKEGAVENELKAAGVEAFLPLEKWAGVRHGRKIEGWRPYLAGYLLVRFLPSAKAFQGLRRQRFVVDIVGAGDGRYHIISDQDVNLFRALIEQPAAPRKAADKSIQEGNVVEVELGPFAGFQCLVVAVKWSREPKARVVIDAGGKNFEIESMPLAFLKKL